MLGLCYRNFWRQLGNGSRRFLFSSPRWNSQTYCPCNIQCNTTDRHTKKSVSFFSQSYGYKTCPKRKEQFGLSSCRRTCKEELCWHLRKQNKCFKGWHKNVEAILIFLLNCLLPLHSINFIIVCSVSIFVQLNLLRTCHTSECNLTDIPRNQLVSSVKAMGIKTAPKENNSLVHNVAEELLM